MNSDDKISIIIPVYNEIKEQLIKCIDSAINQTYKNIEIIIIDDGSDNNSIEICDNYCNKDNRVRVIHKGNGGVSNARNVGISESTANFIVFLDSDDWLEPETCEKFMNNMQEDMDILICNSYINYKHKKVKNKVFQSTNSILSKEQLDDLGLQTIYKKLAKYVPTANSVGTVWGKIFRKSFLLKNNLKFPEDVKKAEDHVFFLQILEIGGGSDIWMNICIIIGNQQIQRLIDTQVIQKMTL